MICGYAGMHCTALHWAASTGQGAKRLRHCRQPLTVSMTPANTKTASLFLRTQTKSGTAEISVDSAALAPSATSAAGNATTFFFRSTNAALVCGIYSAVFSVPFAQNDHTTPLTLALTLSAAAAVFKLAMTLPIAPQVAIDFTVMSEIKIFIKLMRRCSMLFRPNSTK